MLLKYVLFFSLLCAVNGNVIINVFDNDNGADVKPTLPSKSSEQSCNLAWCEQTCRRTGFSGGVCVGDRCKCDILENTRTHIESSVYDCNDWWCNLGCQFLGCIEGKCYNGNCICRTGETIQKHADIVVDNNLAVARTDMESSVSDCKDWCNQECQSMGYIGGKCYNDTCYCRTGGTFQEHADIVADNNLAVAGTDADASVQGCHDWCNDLCRSMGYPGGTCDGETCHCGGKQEKHIESLVQGCKDWCNQACQSMGYRGGKCYNDKCYCITGEKIQKYTNIVDNLAVVRADADASIQGCHDWCNGFCRSMGYPGGTCTGETCHCYRKQEKRLIEPFVPFPPVPAASKNKCNLDHCSAECSEHSFLFVLCSNNKCYCINYHEDGALEASAPGQVCAMTSCNQVCRELNYSRGTCEKDTCQCHKHNSVQSKEKANTDVLQEDSVETNKV